MGSFRKDDDGVFHCVPLGKFTWIDHGFPAMDASNRSLPVTTLKQIHSNLVRNAHGLDDRCLEGDALISDEPGKTIGVRTADCVPILLADTKTRTVAAVHAGWRGTAARIVQRTLEQMAELSRSDVRDIHAAIGPAIGACCYQVGSEVAARFEDIFPELTLDAAGRAMLDLPEANRILLLEAGVPATQIYSSGLCTFCNSEEFFSYRRDQANPGRMLSFITRKN